MFYWLYKDSREDFMYRRILQLTMAAALVSAPLVLRADPIMTGQFSVTGTVQNVGTTLEFSPSDIVVATGSETGSFLTILSNGEPLTNGTANFGSSAYVPGSAFFAIGTDPGALIVTLESLNLTTVGSTLDFSGVANLSTTGFANTLADYSFSTPSSGVSQFTATFIAEAAPSAVPEPSSLALFGSGVLGLIGTGVRKFRSARA
jgi:PEP-CTERM motif-containing protein